MVRLCMRTLGSVIGIEISDCYRNIFPLSVRGTRFDMNETRLSIADIILIAGTRVVLGAGIGLLLSTRLNNDQRKAAGLALALVGGLTTIPLALGVMGKQRAGMAELRQAA